MKLRLLLPCLALGIAPALFAQEGSIITTETVVIPEQAPDPNEPLTMVEKMPEFPGGNEAMMKYFSGAMTYPEYAADAGIQGTVFVAMVVERDGSITDVKVLRGIGGGCDEEAVRVVKSMPKWLPGEQDGKAVRVRYNLPFRFYHQ